MYSCHAHPLGVVGDFWMDAKGVFNKMPNGAVLTSRLQAVHLVTFTGIKITWWIQVSKRSSRMAFLCTTLHCLQVSVSIMLPDSEVQCSSEGWESDCLKSSPSISLGSEVGKVNYFYSHCLFKECDEDSWGNWQPKALRNKINHSNFIKIIRKSAE